MRSYISSIQIMNVLRRSAHTELALHLAAARRIALICLSTAYLLLHGAAYAFPGEAPGDTLVWPSPPDKPRIRFVRSVTSTEELKQKKGFFEKLISIIGGSESSKNWFVQPVGVTVSPSGLVIVTDPGARGIHILNIEKKEYDFVVRRNSAL